MDTGNQGPCVISKGYELRIFVDEQISRQYCNKIVRLSSKSNLHTLDKFIQINRHPHRDGYERMLDSTGIFGAPVVFCTSTSSISDQRRWNMCHQRTYSVFRPFFMPKKLVECVMAQFHLCDTLTDSFNSNWMKSPTRSYDPNYQQRLTS